MTCVLHIVVLLQVQNLTKKLQILQCCKSPVNGEVESNDSKQLQLYVQQLKEQTDSDRNKMTEALSQWADEVITFLNSIVLRLK